MCRVLGIAANGNIIPKIVVGTCSQIYAGDQATGLGYFSQGKNYSIREQSKATEFFAVHGSGILANVAISHNACSENEMQPVEFLIDEQQVVIALDSIENAEQTISNIIMMNNSVSQGVIQALQSVKFPFALVAIDEQGRLIAARNSGIKPLTFGRIDNDGLHGFYVASQSGVLPSGEFVEVVRPGHMLIIAQNSFYDLRVVDDSEQSYCINEPLFKQRPGNYCSGREVNEIRFSIGKALGSKFRREVMVEDPNEYTARPIPDGGCILTAGFGETAKIPFDRKGAIRGKYTIPRKAREIARKCGLSEDFDLTPIPNIEGKIVVIIDDQGRSFGKVERMVQMCRFFGAREVMVAVGTIARNPCPYGDAAYKDRNLIGHGGITCQELANKLGVSRLISLEVTELLEAINTPRRTYCTICLANKP